MVNGDHLERMESIQEDTERDYSQTEYGKNALVVGDGGDGEHSPARLFKARVDEKARREEVNDGRRRQFSGEDGADLTA
jgi:hypothetical protein